MPTVPMLAAENPSAAQICRVKAATEVLPLVPVTAAIVPGWRGYNLAAARTRARRALVTRANAAYPDSGATGDFSAATATAPAVIAAATKPRPSVLLPAIATNRSP